MAVTLNGRSRVEKHAGRRVVCVVAALLFVAAVATEGAAQTEQGIPVAVDARVELMSIIFRLADNPEYNHARSKSLYAREVEAHFGKFRDHAVVEAARVLRRTRGVSYDAVMSMAVHLEDAVDLGERIPLDGRPEKLDSRWRADEARDFLTKARRFVKESEFEAFIRDHKAFYDKAAARMSEKLAEQDYRAWFDGYFGERPLLSFRVAVGLLNGPQNYGVSVRFDDGREELCPVLGVWQFDNEGLLFARSVVSLE